jgi:broad specificity phosphatase PhoE
MTQSKIYYLFRHGLATHCKYGYGKKIVTAHILPEGIPAVQRIGNFLSPIQDSAQYSSEFIRCRETSAIITEQSKKEFIFDARLNEKHHETIGDIRTRVSSFLKYINTKPQSNIIICTHGTIIAAIKNLLIENTFVTRQLHDFPKTGEVVIIEKGKVKIISFN